MVFDDQMVRFVLAVVVVLTGVAFLTGLFVFGKRLFENAPERHFFAELYHYLRHFPPGPRWPRAWLEGVFASYDGYLDKRNDFWQYFGQVALAVLIVVVLAVLLLTKVIISAEAGLPILSAVAGFAIAKTATTQSATRRPSSPQGPDEQ